MPNDFSNNDGNAPVNPQNPFTPSDNTAPVQPMPEVQPTPAAPSFTNPTSVDPMGYRADQTQPAAQVPTGEQSMPAQTPPQVQSASAPEPQQGPQDERIVDYLVTEVIPAKNPNLPADQIVVEKDRLYKMLESGIFETAYSQLNEEQKQELDSLMKYGADIPAIQTFFIEKIPNIQVQLGNYMKTFVERYLRGEI